MVNNSNKKHHIHIPHFFLYVRVCVQPHMFEQATCSKDDQMRAHLLLAVFAQTHSVLQRRPKEEACVLPYLHDVSQLRRPQER